MKKGEKYLCEKDYIMDDGVIDYLKGRIYVCECNGCLTDEQGDTLHKMPLNDEFFEHFKLVE